MTEVIVSAPLALSVPQQTQGVVFSEAITTSTLIGEEGDANMFSFSAQMIEELLNEPIDPSANPSDVVNEAAPAASLSMPAIGTSDAAQASREDDVLAEIAAEMAAGNVGSSPPGPAPLMVISPGGTVLIETAPVPPPATTPMPPARPPRRTSVASSSEEDVDIISLPEGKPEKSKRLRKKSGSGSGGATPKKKIRKKKE
mgnify:CR=1 FL=1